MKKFIILLMIVILYGGQNVWAATPAAPKKPAPKQTNAITISPETNEATLKSHLRVGDPLRVEAMACLGIKAFRNEQPQIAKAYFEDTLRFLPESTYPKVNKVLALTGLAMYDIMEDTNFTAGKLKMEQALSIGQSITQSIDPQQRSLIAKVYSAYAYVVYETGHTTEANLIIEKALTLDSKCTFCNEAQQRIQAFANSPDYFAQIQADTDLKRWNDETKVITVYIASGTGLRDWHPHFVEMAKTAFSSWQMALNGRFEFRLVNKPDIADVRVSWLEPAIPLENGDGAATGHNVHAFLDDYIVQNDIEVSLHYDTGKPISKDEAYTTLLHEIGHMLGLGHSPNPADVMSTESMANVITTRDIATINKLYQMTPPSMNPTGMTLAQFRNQNP